MTSKMKYIIAIFIGLLSMITLGFDKLTDSQSDEPLVETANADAASGHIYITIADYQIALWQKDDMYYAFLPAAFRNIDIEPEIPVEIDPASIVWMYSENIPAVFIETESGTVDSINQDKNVKEAGNISVLDTNGYTTFSFPLEYIKGRGNTSYTEFEKKPYQIKLEESAPFLGMPSAKKWIIISNAPDSTLLRNALSRNLATHLNLAQSDEGVYVDLYLNGVYNGNYYVTEKIEIKGSRLNITDLEDATKTMNDDADFSLYETAWTDTTKAKHIPEEPEDITGGYLIERDFDDRFLKEVEINESYFITDAEECFIVRSPEYASENQISYIDQYVQSVENAILSPDGIDPGSGKSYMDLIDVDSFVRKYLLEEVTANYDGGVASSYFYKDKDAISGKLYAGPIWDYDVTWGNSPDYLGHVSTSPDRLTKLAAHSDSSVWFSTLYAKPEFYEEVISCYQQEVSSYLDILADNVLPLLAELTEASAAMDRVRWEEQYLLNGAEESREEAIAFLTDYIRKRKEFLDDAWIDQIPVHQITLLIENNIYDTLYVFDNEPLPILPEIEIDYAKHIGWMTPDGAAPMMGASVCEDMVFHAILQY